jgi:hypothetical protein
MIFVESRTTASKKRKHNTKQRSNEAREQFVQNHAFYI